MSRQRGGSSGSALGIGFAFPIAARVKSAVSGMTVLKFILYRGVSSPLHLKVQLVTHASYLFVLECDCGLECSVNLHHWGGSISTGINIIV